MKNTLWIFGDSFSWDHKIRIANKNLDFDNDLILKYIKNYLDGEIFESWGEILSNKLNFNYINHASYQSGIRIENLPQGNSNNTAINLLNEFSNQFKKGDIIIFGLTEVTRFEYCYGDKIAQTFSASVTNDEKLNVVKEILVNRSLYDFYLYDTLQKLKSLETLSNVVGFDLWYWDWTGLFDKLVIEEKISNDRWIFFHAQPNYTSYLDLIYKNYNVGPVYWETDGKVNDHHPGKVANKVFADVLINFFKKRLISLNN
jgi:hypothetical protein